MSNLTVVMHKDRAEFVVKEYKGSAKLTVSHDPHIPFDSVLLDFGPLENLNAVDALNLFYAGFMWGASEYKKARK